MLSGGVEARTRWLTAGFRPERERSVNKEVRLQRWTCIGALTTHKHLDLSHHVGAMCQPPTTRRQWPSTTQTHLATKATGKVALMRVIQGFSATPNRVQPLPRRPDWTADGQRIIRPRGTASSAMRTISPLHLRTTSFLTGIDRVNTLGEPD